MSNIQLIYRHKIFYFVYYLFFFYFIKNWRKHQIFKFPCKQIVTHLVKRDFHLELFWTEMYLQMQIAANVLKLFNSILIFSIVLQLPKRSFRIKWNIKTKKIIATSFVCPSIQFSWISYAKKNIYFCFSDDIYWHFENKISLRFNLHRDDVIMNNL